MMIAVRRLGSDDVAGMRALNALYSDAFCEPENYAEQPPSDDWLLARLADPAIVALIAEDGGQVIGGLTGYVLAKLEQARSEIYIYDLAVAESHRRQGIATALIDALQPIARGRCLGHLCPGRPSRRACGCALHQIGRARGCDAL